MKAVEVCGLCKRYGDLRAVDELRFDVERGELFSLLGVNGAGKSTAVRMLCGLTAPDAGDARLMGRSVTKQLREVRSIVGVAPQESAVAPRLTVRENLELIARLHGSDRNALRGVLERSLEGFSLTEVAKQRAGTLSGGWQRRLSIAMALVSEPELLFLDEPTLGLDVLARRELWRVIENLRGRMTIILTTHSMQEAKALSDCVGILRKGRLVGLGTPAELMAATGTATFEDTFVALAAPKEGEL